METGLLIIRVVVGLTLATLGARKLGGRWRDHMPRHVRPGRRVATMAALAETGGGLAFALGLFTPVAAALIVASVIVVLAEPAPEHDTVHEGAAHAYPIMVATIAIGVAMSGPGALSLDDRIAAAGVGWPLLAVALLVGSFCVLLARAVVSSPTPHLVLIAGNPVHERRPAARAATSDRPALHVVRARPERERAIAMLD